MTAPLTLDVLAPGLHTRVVDRGRPRCRSLGVPLGGPADAFSFALGNALVGNSPTAGALEMTLSGPTLILPDSSSGPLACVVFGAPFDLTSDRQELRVGTTFTLRPGERLRVGGTPRGARAYLCVAGGFQTPILLGSRSAFGPLRTGEQLPCLPGKLPGRFIALPTAEREFGAVLLHVVPGGQAGWFREQDLASLQFTVSPASDRMGLRLHGVPLPVPARELVSEPVCPGTVQVTRDGQCILLGVDGQTIGGYPKIAHVIRADLDRLGQLRPGQAVAFAPVSPEQAEQRARHREQLLREWVARLSAGV